MLSRVANNLYWFSRYLRRAENTARLVGVGSLLQLDLPRSVRFDWRPLIDTVGSGELFDDGPGGTNCRHDAQSCWNLLAALTLSLRDLVWEYIYAPLESAVLYAAERLNVLQFLTIRSYLSLVFMALVGLLLVVAIWG